ncbi:hypothetical protein EVAR_16210_1 [Eumeta japonica]|uniref:Uncharacterized protein n=1 Tax=Eumeta variegata TaxID=151549 RepID=A0A4C1U6T1_EUMVA|nr:hypothetical protein EVAR_16210_1 [Eumeta japonica]
MRRGVVVGGADGALGGGRGGAVAPANRNCISTILIPSDATMGTYVTGVSDLQLFVRPYFDWGMLTTSDSNAVRPITAPLQSEYATTLRDEDIFMWNMIKHTILWGFGLTPLLVFYQTRPQHVQSRLMIWITTSPWPPREMGPYGYYLNRPIVSLQENTPHDFSYLRRANSDSQILKRPHKKKRYSKSC